MGKIERIQVPPEDRERFERTGQGPQHAAEDRMAVADCTFGRRGPWNDEIDGPPHERLFIEAVCAFCNITPLPMQRLAVGAHNVEGDAD
jgi:hypothetical protein